MNLDDLPGVELRRAFTTEVGLALVALAELFTAAFWAPTAAARARAAARAAPVAPLFPRAAVGIGTRLESLDVLGLEVLIRISVVVPAKEHVAAMRRELEVKSQTRKLASHL